MRAESTYFDVSPKIIPVGRESVISIRPMFDHCRFREGITYQVALLPAEGYPNQTSWIDSENQVGPIPNVYALFSQYNSNLWKNVPKHQVQPVSGKISVPYTFLSEQEYVLILEQVKDGQATFVAEFRVYALDADLFELRPFKGDTHNHTCHSDGIESPAFVAGSSRRIGLDFMAVTDHGKYAPSLEAIEAFKSIDTDMRIYPGEEVHPPGNPVHIVNFGGTFSVNDLFRDEAYLAEVKALEKTLPGLPDGVDKYTYASCVWCFDKIRKARGLGVFCHPYWMNFHRCDVPGCLTDLLFENQPYDALELIGGYFRHETESNTLQVARYHEERANGKHIPIAGASDSHGCVQKDLFGWYYTIVFAPSSDLEDLIESIKSLNSVAVEAIPGETTRAYGPFRLVRYAQYLLREIFPAHDELCAEEGRLMLAYLAGDQNAANLIGNCKGHTAKLYDHLWGAK